MAKRLVVTVSDVINVLAPNKVNYTPVSFTEYNRVVGIGHSMDKIGLKFDNELEYYKAIELIDLEVAKETSKPIGAIKLRDIQILEANGIRYRPYELIKFVEKVKMAEQNPEVWIMFDTMDDFHEAKKYMDVIFVLVERG